MRGTFALVREMLAQDPAYRPAHPLRHDCDLRRSRAVTASAGTLDLGLPMRTARISALRQLVLQVPAPVIAGALGFHHTTTTR